MVCSVPLKENRTIVHFMPCCAIHSVGGNTVMHRLDRLREILRHRGLQNSILHGLRRLLAYRNITLFGPDMIRINPMSAICNHRCSMCWLQTIPEDTRKNLIRQDQHDRMNAPDYDRIFRNMPAGLREVNVVGGGEPLLHPEIHTILRSIKRNGFRGSLITNGTNLTPELAETLVDIRWDLVRISVSAGDRDTYRLVQGVDRFDRLIRNIRILNRFRSANPPPRMHLSVFHVLQRDNISNPAPLFGIAEQMEADSIEFDPLIPLNPDLALSRDELATAIEELPKTAARSPVPSNLSEIVSTFRKQLEVNDTRTAFIPARRCSVGYDQCFIHANGDVYPCCFSDEKMGNLKSTSFREIWHGKQFKAFRRRLMSGKFAYYCIEKQCSLPGVLLNR